MPRARAHVEAPADLAAACTEAGIRHLDLQFTDVMGAVKTVTIPADQIGDALEHGVWFDGSSVESVARTAESDMYLRPDSSTFAILPWAATPTARLICWVTTPEGEPYSGDPRGALSRAIGRARALGYEYRLGPEIEFYLLSRDSSGTPAPLPHDRGGYFDFATDTSVAVRQVMAETVRALGIEVNTVHHEIAAGQHEIDLGHGEALHAADDIVTFRYTLKAIAQQHDLIASFMPKPFASQPGSGMHMHQSLARITDGQNAFSGSDDYGLSEVAKQFIAGQLHHAAGMCLVLAPLVNSYKRLVRGFEAPIFVSWARTNRGALVRIPHVACARRVAQPRPVVQPVPRRGRDAAVRPRRHRAEADTAAAGGGGTLRLRRHRAGAPARRRPAGQPQGRHQRLRVRRRRAQHPRRPPRRALPRGQAHGVEGVPRAGHPVGARAVPRESLTVA